MSIKVEKTENKNEVKLEFTIEAEKFEQGMKTVYQKNARYFNIPGFRKGKAPYNIVEKHYGPEIFYEDAFNEVVPEVYEEAIKANDLEVVSSPKIDVTQMEKGKELVFTAVVQIKPEVKLGKYKGIEIPKIEYNVSDEDIEKEIEAIADKNSRLVTVEDRAVEDKDVAVIDFEGFVDGVAFEGGKAENHELEIGSHSFIDGFEDQVIGMKVGEEKEINVKFPEKYFSEDLAGKDAMFKVKLHEIKKKELPKIDDEFAKDVSEYDTLEELKASIRKRDEEENEHRAKHEKEDAAIKAVCDNAEVDIPSGMIETELSRIMQDMDMNLSYQGLNLAKYLQMIGKTEEDFKKDYEEQAKESVKSRLVLEAVSKDAKIEVTDADIAEKLEELAKSYGKSKEELEKNEELKKYVKENLSYEKTIDYILSNAKIK
mgnify:FL=1